MRVKVSYDDVYNLLDAYFKEVYGEVWRKVELDFGSKFNVRQLSEEDVEKYYQLRASVKVSRTISLASFKNEPREISDTLDFCHAEITTIIRNLLYGDGILVDHIDVDGMNDIYLCTLTKEEKYSRKREK